MGLIVQSVNENSKVAARASESVEVLVPRPWEPGELYKKTHHATVVNTNVCGARVVVPLKVVFVLTSHPVDGVPGGELLGQPPPSEAEADLQQAWCTQVCLKTPKVSLCIFSYKSRVYLISFPRTGLFPSTSTSTYLGSWATTEGLSGSRLSSLKATTSRLAILLYLCTVGRSVTWEIFEELF
jgi:hypothetical protein